MMEKYGVEPDAKEEPSEPTKQKKHRPAPKKVTKDAAEEKIPDVHDKHA